MQASKLLKILTERIQQFGDMEVLIDTAGDNFNSGVIADVEIVANYSSVVHFEIKRDN